MNIYDFLNLYRDYPAAPVSLSTGNMRLEYRGIRPDGKRSWYVIHFDGFTECNIGEIHTDE